MKLLGDLSQGADKGSRVLGARCSSDLGVKNHHMET